MFTIPFIDLFATIVIIMRIVGCCIYGCFTRNWIDETNSGHQSHVDQQNENNSVIRFQTLHKTNHNTILLGVEWSLDLMGVMNKCFWIGESVFYKGWNICNSNQKQNKLINNVI
jgi:predicted membrane channel-forming protein YqfA (hemolysin III family)